jgi:hypothetical protein
MCMGGFRIRGGRVQDTKKIGKWLILHGVKVQCIECTPETRGGGVDTSKIGFRLQPFTRLKSERILNTLNTL